MSVYRLNQKILLTLILRTTGANAIKFMNVNYGRSKNMLQRLQHERFNAALSVQPNKFCYGCKLQL